MTRKSVERFIAFVEDDEPPAWWFEYGPRYRMWEASSRDEGEGEAWHRCALLRWLAGMLARSGRSLAHRLRGHKRCGYCGDWRTRLDVSCDCFDYEWRLR